MNIIKKIKDNADVFFIGVILTFIIIVIVNYFRSISNFTDLSKTISAIEEEIELAELEDAIESDFEGFVDIPSKVKKAKVMAKAKSKLAKNQTAKRVRKISIPDSKKQGAMIITLTKCKTKIDKLRSRNKKCRDHKDALLIIIKLLNIEIKRNQQQYKLKSSSMLIREKAMINLRRLDAMKIRIQKNATSNVYINKHYKELLK